MLPALHAETVVGRLGHRDGETARGDAASVTLDPMASLVSWFLEGFSNVVKKSLNRFFCHIYSNILIQSALPTSSGLFFQ